MRQYKDSGIEWIGKIPEMWEYKRFKYSGVFEKGKLPNSSNIERIGLPIIGASEMLGKDARTYTSDTTVPKCSVDDILILWDGANAGITASGLNGVVSSTAVKYTCIDKSIFPKYVAYLLKYGENYFKEKVNGTTIPHMNMVYINDIPLLCPPFSVQQHIADYLDSKCGEIDSLIALQEQMIESLKAYKQSVITEAVTKGLNPNAKLVPSGIDWIGEIPEGWEVCRIKDLATMKSGSNLTSEQIANEGSYPVYGGNGLRGYYEDYSNEGDYVLVGRQGALCGNINYASGRFWATDHAVVCYPRREFSLTWFGETLRSMNLGQYSLSAAQPGLSVDRIREIKMPLPPLSEQRLIASYLDSKCADIDRLIALKQLKIEALKDYKKSVIYEAVTGKTIIE